MSKGYSKGESFAQGVIVFFGITLGIAASYALYRLAPDHGYAWLEWLPKFLTGPAWILLISLPLFSIVGLGNMLLKHLDLYDDRQNDEEDE